MFTLKRESIIDIKKGMEYSERQCEGCKYFVDTILHPPTAKPSHCILLLPLWIPVKQFGRCKHHSVKTGVKETDL